MPILSVKEVCRRLNESGIPWVVFAGAAANVYGASRQITDIDILVSSSNGKQIKAIFPEGQTQYREDGSIAGLQLVGIDIIAGLKGLYSLEVDEEMMERVTDYNIGGVTMPVIPVEDNILLKAAWGRGVEVGKHDWEDVRAMMAHCPRLDWDYINMRAGVSLNASQASDILERLKMI